MSAHTILSAVAGAAATSVVEHDAIGAVDQLLADGTAALGASAAGILILDANDRLEFLAATSHALTDLEVYQSLSDEGPCAESVRTGTAITVSAAQDIVDRWPTTGALMLANGLTGVHSSPLQWLGHTFGALNVFFDGDRDLGPDVDLAGRTLADAATLLIVTSGSVTVDTLAGSIEQALEVTAVVEQAKGALSQVRGMEMGDAFDALRAAAAASGTSLGETARDVLDQARRGHLH